MRRNCLFIPILLLVFSIGCGKKSGSGDPVLKLEKVNTTQLPHAALLRFSFKFESKKTVDSIYVQKLVPACTDSEFAAFFKVPDYPTTLENGDIELTFSNGFTDSGPVDLNAPKCGADDQATFRFVLKDVDDNYSDTIVSPMITILQ